MRGVYERGGAVVGDGGGAFVRVWSAGGAGRGFFLLAGMGSSAFLGPNKEVTSRRVNLLKRRPGWARECAN